LGLNKQNKLLKTKDFHNVRKTGQSWSDHNLVLVVSKHELFLAEDNTRIGFIVSNKIGNAVVRNKCKRRLRELISKIEIVNGFDLVFIARKSIVSSRYDEIQASVISLLKRAKLIKSTAINVD
tara:strand:- start:4141 stop:4509 length:369 start_codon:yes stop_codon:yes gene_type:complete